MIPFSLYNFLPFSRKFVEFLAFSETLPQVLYAPGLEPSQGFCVPQGVVNVTPNDEATVIMADQSVRGALRWKPADSDCRFLSCCYVPQYQLVVHLEKAIRDSVVPEAQELVEIVWRTHEKEIIKQEDNRLILNQGSVRDLISQESRGNIKPL